jgi:hypothetical protein
MCSLNYSQFIDEPIMKEKGEEEEEDDEERAHTSKRGKKR